jgi:uncharacterized iron-regulated protein
MARWLLVAVICLGSAPWGQGQGPASDTKLGRTELDKTLRSLEKQIEAARGLKYKKPVSARIVPRPTDADRNVQGYYSVKDKAIFLYDDIKGSYQRGVLIHEMVHALQDQHFGLAKLHQQSFDSDAELALAALVEGDATFTMIDVLKKDQPRVAAMFDAPLDKAKNLRNAFLYAQGARYVKALKGRGGWKAVNTAYRFKPRTTATILHPRGAPTISLGPGKTRGEYALIDMLRSSPRTASHAVQAASGWMADRYGAQGDLKWWEVVFSNAEHARLFQEELSRLREAQQPRFKAMPSAAGDSVRKNAAGAVRAVLLRSDRVLALEAPNEDAYTALLQRLEGPPPMVVYSKAAKAFVSFDQMMDRLLDASLICIGDEHDSEPNHRVQLRIVEALFARDKQLGVGMEMFQRPFQDAIDRHMQGKTTDDVFLKETEFQKRWGYPWMLYRPIVEFCRQNGVPLAALNLRRELVQSLSKSGYEKLSADEKSQIGPVDFHVKEHRSYWYDRLAKMHGNPSAPAEQKERSYQVMTAWDEYMGASAAAFQKARKLRRMVLLAGSGHIDRGFGIPARAAKRTGGKVATIHIDVGADPAKATAEPVTDFIVIVK